MATKRNCYHYYRFWNEGQEAYVKARSLDFARSKFSKHIPNVNPATLQWEEVDEVPPNKTFIE